MVLTRAASPRKEKLANTVPNFCLSPLANFAARKANRREYRK